MVRRVSFSRRRVASGGSLWANATKIDAADMAVNSAGELFFVGNFRDPFNASPAPGTANLSSPGTTPVPFVIKWTQ